MPRSPKSRSVSTASSLAGSQKLGQPVPDSYFVCEREELGAAARAAVRPGLLGCVVLPCESALRRLLAQHAVLLGRQFCLPLLFGLLHFLGHAFTLPARVCSGCPVSPTELEPCSNQHVSSALDASAKRWPRASASGSRPVPRAASSTSATPISSSSAFPTARSRRSAAAIPVGPWIAHTSGAQQLEVLAPHERRFSLHPLQTFTLDRGPEQLDGAWAAVSGETAEALAAGARWPTFSA